MSEEMKNMEVITDEEANEAAGGKSKSSKPEKTNHKCNQCAMKGKMSNYLYKFKGVCVCKEGHVHSKGYEYLDRRDDGLANELKKALSK